MSLGRASRPVLIVILLIGAVLRVVAYLQETPLTRDEMSLALNVGTRSPRRWPRSRR